jgi:hypothetical protein
MRVLSIRLILRQSARAQSPSSFLIGHLKV